MSMRDTEFPWFVYFPLGFTNRSGFKSGLLTQAHVSLVRGEASLGESLKESRIAYFTVHLLHSAYRIMVFCHGEANANGHIIYWVFPRGSKGIPVIPMVISILHVSEK
uniref:Uncharacterized protein n=1 Tax=Candidatus Kentrum sp. SD TaxID=2126332 RepID=A0A451BN81_9GAMM|nr:MAG: hypothetical protein BECKSD772D_GA0070982_10624 [Candidatus Kentron sp. SD]